MKEYFGLKYHNTTYAAEIRDGLSIFLSIAYIFAINPAVLSGCGMDYYSVFMATIITAFVSTLIMAVYAKLPMVLAPGLSMNTLFVAVTMECFGGDYRITFLATYLSGVLFIGLVAVGAFERIERWIPTCVKHSVLAGLGVALMRTGLESVDFFENMMSWDVALTFLGVACIVLFMIRRMKGAVIYGMVIVCLLGYLVTLRENGISYGLDFRTVIASYEMFEWNWELFFENCFNFPSLQVFMDSPSLLLNLVVVSVMFTVFHFTDSTGTTSSLFAFMEDRGTEMPERYKRKGMQVNGIASVISGLMGTSTATTYAESAIAIAQGAKTGITGLTVCVMLMITGLIAPFLQNMRPFVTAPALIVAGLMSAGVLKRMKGKSLFEMILAGVTTIYIGLTFEIASGLIWSMSIYTLFHIIKEKEERSKHFVVLAGMITVGICLIVFQKNLI